MLKKLAQPIFLLATERMVVEKEDGKLSSHLQIPGRYIRIVDKSVTNLSGLMSFYIKTPTLGELQGRGNHQRINATRTASLE